ncbi:type IV pilus secretin family protein [Malonomonas rubra]|uniref:type IV pilus secretin family protein n=1 Tax=Malonomonas rubra TaxID=57040 RepID=UPI0026EDB032|nr:type IV pilus secretin family protein [Malonomonas rubra]
MKKKFQGIGNSLAGRITAMLSIATFVCVGSVWAAANQIVSVAMEEGAASPTLLIQTSEPVGYRYTVYDSFDPVRVIIDFPGMALTNLPEEIAASPAPLQNVRLGKYDLAAGPMARIEMVLAAAADYQVTTDGNSFRLIFPGVKSVLETSVAPVMTAEAEQAHAMAHAQAQAHSLAKEQEQTPEIKPAAPPATVVKDVAISAGRALFATNGDVNRFEHFVLANPPRLVVDLYGVTTAFKTRTFSAGDGIKQLRIGSYADKVRGVFDAAGPKVPEFKVEKQIDGVAVAWGKGLESFSSAATEPVAVSETSATKKKGPVSAQQVTVETFEFTNQDGLSSVVLGLSAPANVTAPKLDGNQLRFEVKNATISRSLRRTIDASGFPSAVSTVTPYVFTEKGKQGVRFAVELKGPVDYRLDDQGETVKLIVEDGAFAEALPPAMETKELVVDIPEEAAPAVGEFVPGQLPVASMQKPVYTGQKISLVFDDADIRNILQLIGDVSGLNILASNDVKGTITLRLIDVPWDQALDLVLETSDLGKIQEGNVVRIMPAKKLREREVAAMQAAKEDIEQGVLETHVFQVNYAAIGDVVKNLEPLKSGRGTITPDTRNKQLIIKDSVSVLEQMAVMIKTVDRPERQVLIEARIVEVNTNFARDLGVRWGFNYSDTPNGDDLESAAVGLGGSFLITPPASGTVGTSSGATAGLLFGLLDGTANLAVRLSALESQGEGKIISTPRVTTLNGQKALISQGTKIPYTVTSDQGADTKFESAELKLEVTPEINPDGSIILDVKASNSTVGDVVPQASGGTAISINDRKAETKVLVRDGSTTVIGGIFVEDERTADTGVPLLKDIPFLGYFFKSESKSSSRKEILIFITPRIVEA